MGSIRPPHRLKYTKRTDNDICTHQECKGAKADTEHIFWDCCKWDHIRKPYMHQLKIYEAKISSQAERKQAIDDLLCTPCFKQCGICPGDDRLLRATYNLHNDDRIHYQTPPENSNLEGELHTTCNESQYLRVYTDGSCTDGTLREKSRAGWGVFVAPKHPDNWSSPLPGPAQTSYRAEVYTTHCAHRKTTNTYTY